MANLLPGAALAAAVGAIALSAPLSPAFGEGATLTSVKAGACALLTADDARRVWKVPMQVAPSSPGQDFPGRTCAYRPARRDLGNRSLQLRLLDAGEWGQVKSGAAGKLEIAGMTGIADEAYFVRARRGPHGSVLVLFARRGSSQFSIRVAGAGAGLEPTEPLKQAARSVAARL